VPEHRFSASRWLANTVRQNSFSHDDVEADRAMQILFASTFAAIFMLAISPRAVAQAAPPPVPSASWLNLLPDGPDKRRFLLDCTGCHQLDERIARFQGRPRTAAEWSEAVRRMLGFAGATTGFPVISGDRRAEATGRWLAEHLSRTPSTPAATDVVAGRAEITEYVLPAADDLPHDVALDDSGRVIITGMMTHRMYVLDPGTGQFAVVPVPVERANPRAVETDSAGNWWVVLGMPQRIARFVPGQRQWQTFPVGMYPHSLALDSTGAVWFNGHFTRNPELIGRLAGPATQRFSVPAHPVLGARPGGPIPYEIRVAPDGRVWGSELVGNRLFVFDPRSSRFETYDMPQPHSGPRRFDIDADGILWIPAYGTNELVRFDPRTKSFSRFPLPIRDATPYVVRIDQSRGTIWVGTAAADAMLSFDPSTKAFAHYPLPSRGALVRHLAVDPVSHAVWVAYGAFPSAIPARIARLRPIERQAGDTVRIEVGSPLVDGSVYPAHSGRVTRLRIEGQRVDTTGSWTNHLEIGDSAGTPVHRWHTTGTVTSDNGGRTRFELWQTFDARTLALYAYHLRSDQGALIRLSIDGRRVWGIRRAGGDSLVTTVDFMLPRPGYVGGAVDLVPQAIAGGLRVDVAMRLPVWSPPSDKIMEQVWAVRRRTTTEFEGRQVPAWEMIHFAPDGVQRGTIWLIDQPPYMVRWDLEAASGRITRFVGESLTPSSR
jgi:streptogramin lyase